MEEIIEKIVEAKKIWEEKYEKDYGKWGEIVRINPEDFKDLLKIKR